MRAAPLLAVLLAVPAKAAPLHAGLGAGFGGGPDDTGAFLSGTIFVGSSALPWMDARLVFVRYSNAWNFVGEKPELRAVAGLLGLQIHAALVGPVELIASAAAGLGRVSEPLPLVFGSRSGRRTDLAWQYGAGFRLVPSSRRYWVGFEWVATQFAHYPNEDRLAYVEGRMDGPVVSFGVEIR